MRTTALATAWLVMSTVYAAAHGPISGDYVEARTAEVFTGGCIMNSEAETMGRQAVLAWRIAKGQFADQRLDGLSVVAVIVGDRNLGMPEMGGEEPLRVRSVVLVDERATPAQREALVKFVGRAAGALTRDVVAVRATPISFVREAARIDVAAGDARLSVETQVRHDPGCGAMLWFHPLTTLQQGTVGLTRTQVYSGTALGSRWQQADRRSAFWGSFAF